MEEVEEGREGDGIEVWKVEKGIRYVMDTRRWWRRRYRRRRKRKRTSKLRNERMRGN